MKKVVLSLTLASMFIVSGIGLAGCGSANFSLNDVYTKTGEIISYLDNDSSYSRDYELSNVCSVLPSLGTHSLNAVSVYGYDLGQITKEYDAIFAVSYNYIKNYKELLNISELEMKDLNMGKDSTNKLNTLGQSVEKWKESLVDFSEEIVFVNEYIVSSNYNTKSAKVVMLGFQKEYAKVVGYTLETAKALSEFNKVTYPDSNYVELAGNTAVKTKSLYKEYVLQITDVYYNYLIESVNGKKPGSEIEQNDNSEKVLEMYNELGDEIYDFIKLSFSRNTSSKLSEESFKKMIDQGNVFSEEKGIFERNIVNLDWHKFIFSNNCEIQDVDVQSKAYFNQICFFMQNDLIHWSDRLHSVFTA